ncbi:unnamed protein product [Linum trigynum]|uniref:Uncharacterized protein n=1 Tax=Linum trigynum TaxID=586398 RepID=A0AAV2CK97_9ROSI
MPLLTFQKSQPLLPNLKPCSKFPPEKLPPTLDQLQPPPYPVLSFLPPPLPLLGYPHIHVQKLYISCNP